ncbi:heterochromatin protein [Penicillium taxi]|uniref:heterochromatin protein n=1 Tax=Penicillium taxi TaxID=168475 RepID=UPI00254500C6|nr:heterochromatin protein [Penicillium taxi]KAJ5899448.1 heterochromatin protein [Penicillium taxi]
MPPPVEEVSDDEIGEMPYEDDVSDEETGDIPFNDAKPESEKADNEDEETESEATDEDGILLVRWKGYPKIDDHTWEQESGLLGGAKEAVMEYYVKIGGRPKKPTAKPTAKPGSKRKSLGGKKSPATAKTDVKKRRRSAKAESETTTTDVVAAEDSTEGDWSPPKGKSWEKEVETVDTITRDPASDDLFVYLLWKNGKRSQVAIERCYEKCPRKMLKFYEQHLVFKDG